MKTRTSFQKGHEGYWLGKNRKGTFSEEFKEKMKKLSVGRRPQDSPTWRSGMKGKKQTAEAKRKMSLSRMGRFKGKDNPFWKGGTTPINALIRSSSEYKLWRVAVFERDNYICVWCGARGKDGVYLEADHIKPFAYYPELRFAIDNGRTLCKECHKKTDTYKQKSYGAKY